MGDTGTVVQLAEAIWGVRPEAAHETFTEPGWSYEEPVAKPCPRCGATMHGFRRLPGRAGSGQRDAAVVCPKCPASYTLAGLGVTSYRKIRRRVEIDEAIRRERILRFWRSVELFGAQKLDPPNARENRYRIGPRQPLPWESRHPLRQQPTRPGYVWQHTVYGGVFSLDRLHTSLEQVFGSSGPDVDERTPRGESALFAVVVTSDGRLLLDTVVLSMAAWALGRAHRPGPNSAGWLDGFETVAGTFIATVNRSEAAEDDDKEAAKLANEGVMVSRPIDRDAVDSLTDLAAEHLGVAELLAPSGLRVHSARVSRKRAYEAQVDFLNSLFVEDLARAADAVADGDCGPALAKFLTTNEVPETDRINVRDDTHEEELLERLAPARVPAGRWPTNPRHPLATSQQLAINEIVDRLGEQAGMFAVNGPPGTGKTTMLRDLIAALVVNRARLLAELPTPAAGFGKEIVAWRTGHYPRRIRPVRQELTGFEMVVASANNSAVANVTREIPQEKAIDQFWVDEAGYFSEHATRVLGESAWGMVAAALGNKGNCGDFVSRFWFGRTADPAKRPGEEGPSFQEWLDEATANWTEAVSAFRSAVATELRLRRARQEAHEALRRLRDLQQAHDAASRAVQVAARVHRTAVVDAQAAERAAASASQVAHAARERRRDHRSVKPGVWEILFTVGRAIRRWHAEDEPLAAAATTAEAAAVSAAAAADTARNAVVAAAGQESAAVADRDRAGDAVAAARRKIAAVSQDVGRSLPDAEWRRDATGREVAGPWLDEKWNAARTRVFLAALDLHAAFIAGAAKTVQGNLRAAMDLLNGLAPSDAPELAIRQVWQSLFLVVPVISTTFASAGRLLGGLGREALGWLLIDEAGQASPQAAAGTIWRARRVVAVGDPLQLEPVVTALHTTQAKLMRHHGVAERWLPDQTTVQELADRVTEIGTWLPGPDDTPVWVGAPLRVHRRCDNPMFKVVNTAVYDGLMIHATPSRSDSLSVVDSTWIDVPAAAADGHWLPAEGDATLQIVRYLLRQGVDPGSIMAISPFRRVGDELRRLLAHQYPKLTSGTVHTAQGREADVVLFVLGSDPAKPGARNWAASRPNLFNVAVSRARLRLYVIGNHHNWAGLRYFGTLAHALPVRPIRNPART